MTNVQTYYGPRTEFAIVKRGEKFHAVPMEGMMYGANLGGANTFEAACKIADDFDNAPLIVVAS